MKFKKWEGGGGGEKMKFPLPCWEFQTKDLKSIAEKKRKKENNW